MNLTSSHVDYIVLLAKEVETQDSIDWGSLNIGEDEAYRLIAANTIESLKDKYNDPSFRDIMIATIVKLVVENFTLHLRLQERQ